MSALWVICSLICFALIRYWRVVVPLAIILIAVGLENAKEDRMKFRRYDPQEWTDDQLQQSVRIVVPAFVNDAGGEYPVTIVNNASRAFDGQFYVLCTATETVLDGTTEWVLGIKQYPYLLVRQMTIKSASISTEQFRPISKDMGPFPNVTKCKLYSSDTDESAVNDAIETRWVRVTPRGAARAHEIGYTWMGWPLSANSGQDYQNPFWNGNL